MSIEVNLIEASQAHRAIQTLWLKLKAELIAGNKQVLTVKSFEEALTEKQRKYYHGYILLTIAQSVTVEGRKYPLAVWKEHYRAKFLPDEVSEVIDVKTGASRRELRRVSSESLSVRGYNKLIDQVTADSSTEYGVVFDANFNEWMANEKT